MKRKLKQYRAFFRETAKRTFPGVASLATASLFLSGCCLVKGVSTAGKCPCHPGNTAFYAMGNLEKTNSALVPNDPLPCYGGALGQSPLRPTNPPEFNGEDDLPSDTADSDDGFASQNNQGAKLPLGISGVSSHVVGGANVAFLHGKKGGYGCETKYSPGAGFHIGLDVSYHFSDNFSVTPGISFRQYNATEKTRCAGVGEMGEPTPGMEYKSKLRYNYLSAPIMAELRVHDKFSVSAGPEINYLLDASVRSNNQKTDIADNSVRLGLGVEAGAKYDFSEAVSAEVKINQRISALNKDDGDHGGNYGGQGSITSFWLFVLFDLCELFGGY